MDWLRRLSWAFVAGCVGTIGFYIGIRIGMASGLVAGPPPVMEFLASKEFFYRQVTWGGIWGLLFVVPFLSGMWWLRGMIVGLLATLAAVFIFRPEVPPLPLIVNMVVLNAGFWGLTAGFWHDKVMLGGRDPAAAADGANST